MFVCVLIISHLPCVVHPSCKESLIRLPGVMDFSAGPVDFIHNLPNGQVMFWAFMK